MAFFAADAAQVQRYWHVLATSYGRRNRYYHNLSHIDALVQLLEPLRKQITDYTTVLLAVFYHDAVYNTLRQDNEAKSAALAAAHLRQLNVPQSNADTCCNYILATRLHELHADNDCNLFMDADLAVLGAAPVVYEQYAACIRKEYKWYPDIVYNKGRKQVLNNLLQQARLYKTSVFADRFEAQARLNIKAELSKY